MIYTKEQRQLYRKCNLKIAPAHEKVWALYYKGVSKFQDTRYTVVVKKMKELIASRFWEADKFKIKPI